MSRKLSIGDLLTQRLGLHKNADSYVMEVVKITSNNVMMKPVGRNHKGLNRRMFTMSRDMVATIMVFKDTGDRIEL